MESGRSQGGLVIQKILPKDAQNATEIAKSLERAAREVRSHLVNLPDFALLCFWFFMLEVACVGFELGVAFAFRDAASPLPVVCVRRPRVTRVLTAFG